MGGHSHWAGIKHKKALTDAKKGKVYTKIIREITIAAKMGGGDPASNPRLRKAMEDGRNANMPADNVKRAIMKGTGQLPGTTFEELVYEGYGPGGTALLVETTTDNKNRSFSEIRKIFETGGGSIGSAGCVAWMFKQKGCIIVAKTSIDEEKLMNLALEAGADDIKSEDAEVYEIYTTPQAFDTVKAKLDENKIVAESAEITMIADNQVAVDEASGAKLLKLMDSLEAHDDVKNIYSNFDIPDEILAKLEKA
ncbi:MAG: YebC/PmpR family DNA-binding transcriptional regulator [Elusimicrobia bacterium]|nr:YebC/PmpR family DNA-binding transcriptional regulator [Elusimicrobiota bacterium]